LKTRVSYEHQLTMLWYHTYNTPEPL